LIEFDADVNQARDDGATALYTAAQNGHETIVQIHDARLVTTNAVVTRRPLITTRLVVATPLSNHSNTTRAARLTTRAVVTTRPVTTNGASPPKDAGAV
jgi:hypothetical protein